MDEQVPKRIHISFQDPADAGNALDLAWLAAAIEEDSGVAPEREYGKVEGAKSEGALTAIEIINTGVNILILALTALSFLPKKTGKKYRITFTSGRFTRVFSDLEHPETQQKLAELTEMYPKAHFIVESYEP